MSTVCYPMNCSMPGLPVHHQLPQFTQTHVHWVRDAIQPSHPLSSPSSPAFNLAQHQGLFKWVSSSHQVAKVLEFQLQHHSLSDRMWSTGEGNGKPLQYSCLTNSMNSMKRQKDMTERGMIIRYQYTRPIWWLIECHDDQNLSRQHYSKDLGII